MAQYRLGRAGGHFDRDIAMLHRAATGGLVRAQASMGFRMRENEQWVEAARWFRRSAEQGDPMAQREFALRLYRGQGVPRDRGRAFQYMLRAARSGDATAQYSVGMMYQLGNGTERDVAKGRHWLQRSADNGNEDARERLKSLLAVSTGGSETGKAMRAVKRSNVHAGPRQSRPPLSQCD